MRKIRQSRKLQNVRYDVRGPILLEAQRLEAEGHHILKLNIGNTAPFGFDAPEAIVADIVHHLPDSQGYSDSQGIYPARTAVAQYYQSHGLRDVSVEDVFIGNGVSELIGDGAAGVPRRRQRDPGPGARLPAVDRRGHAVGRHRRCTTSATRSNGWNPDLADIEAKITENTHGLVIINPNNPTGAVYSEDDRQGSDRHRAPARAGGLRRRDLREDHLRRRGAPPRRDVRRQRRAVPDLQRALEGLPRLRLPRGVADDLRSQGGRRGLPRGPHPGRQHADVRQRPGPARDPDGAGRLPVRSRS